MYNEHSFRSHTQHATITMLFSARLRPPSHIRSFLNSKFGMTLVHLKIEKYRISRPRPIDGSDLVLTEWTPHRKSTHKMKNRSWIWRFPEVFCSLWLACGAPMPCGAGSSAIYGVLLECVYRQRELFPLNALDSAEKLREALTAEKVNKSWKFLTQSIRNSDTRA